MSKVFIVLFFVALLLTNNVCNETLLASGIGSNEFGVAFLGITAALLMRNGDKK